MVLFNCLIALFNGGLLSDWKCFYDWIPVTNFFSSIRAFLLTIFVSLLCTEDYLKWFGCKNKQLCELHIVWLSEFFTVQVGYRLRMTSVVNYVCGALCLWYIMFIFLIHMGVNKCKHVLDKIWNAVDTGFHFHFCIVIFPIYRLVPKF